MDWIMDWIMAGLSRPCLLSKGNMSSFLPGNKQQVSCKQERMRNEINKRFGSLRLLNRCKDFDISLDESNSSYAVRFSLLARYSRAGAGYY